MGVLKSCVRTVFIYVVAIRREMAPAPLHDHLTHVERTTEVRED